MTAASPLARSKALSLPNILTYGRLLAVPAVVALLFWPKDDWTRWPALAIFIAAGVTDYLDGYFARLYAQQSTLGRMLDPIADKLLVAARGAACSFDQGPPRALRADAPRLQRLSARGEKGTGLPRRMRSPAVHPVVLRPSLRPAMRKNQGC